MPYQGLRIAAGMSGMVISLWLAACGGEDGGTSPGTTGGSEGGGGGGGGPTPVAKLVYLADQDIDGMDELYLAGSSSIKLNPSLSTRYVISGYEILPDRSGVVYRANQDVFEKYELYLVKFDNPGVSIKMTPPQAGTSVMFTTSARFRIIPDGSGVVYPAKQEPDGPVELYRATFSNPGTSTKLNGPLITGGEVSSFEILPNSSGVVYVADQDTDEKRELFLAQFATPGMTQKLNPPLANDRDVLDGPQILPDSTGVVYLANETSPSFDLYRVPFGSPGGTTQLTGPLNRTFNSFLSPPAITPDGAGVVFLGPNETGPGQELYRVALANPGVNIKLNGTLISQGSVIQFFLIPDGSGAIYAADQDTDGVYELYRRNFAAPDASVKVSGPPPGPQEVAYQGVAMAPDSQSLVYAVSPPSGLVELRHVNLATPGMTTLLQGPLPILASIPRLGLDSKFMVTPDSTGVLYLGQEISLVGELFRVDFATPALATKQNGPLVSNGDVKDFAVR
ncbi:MAG: hypothetical protein NW703_12550 [Nitrospiraceae bacterium]